MQLSDLELIIENLTGSYKKFADSLEEYPVLGVTYPTHYGYIKGYLGEDGMDLDVFIGNGPIYGTLRINRDDARDGVETKFFLGINQQELDAIKAQFAPVINAVDLFDEARFLEAIQAFKNT